jgi:ATP-dependent RNA helicase RhlE
VSKHLYFTPASSIAIYGGRGGQEMEQEKRALKRGASIIVATPGRLKSHLDLGYVNLKTVKYLILDEADRMLDMGFAPDIMHIVNKLPRERQTLLFSATMPHVIRKFAKQLLRDPEEVNIAISKPAEKILQGIYEIEDHGKIPLVEHLLADKKEKRTLIFAGTKKAVKELAQKLHQKKFNSRAVHSDLDQKEREDALLQFKNGNVRIIVATDVLSRGIDISGIDVVINYDVPQDAEDYIHRIGRTARADASGVALTFVNGQDCYKIKRIEELMEMEVMRVPLPPGIPGALDRPCSERKGRSSGGRGGRGRGGYSRGGRKGGGGRGGRSSSNRRTQRRK